MSTGPAAPTPPATPSGDRALEVRGLTKRFGALTVLRGIDLELRQGEVLGLVGDNGAGKSTLVKILSGLYTPDGGELRVGGELVRFHSVADSRGHGIETVYQDLALIPQLPVYLNLFLGHELTSMGRLRFLDKRTMRKLARQYLDEIHVRVPSIDAEADRLSGGQRQAIAVARAVRAAPKILLLDEPLSAMGARERPGLDHRHRPQLRPPLRAVRPHQRHAGWSRHHRPAGAGDVARGAHQADDLELPQPGRGRLERGCLTRS
jgi:simple sugar transport system ATP-binding protein